MLCADKYMEAHLEIPDIVMTSTNVEKSTVDPALRVTPVKRRRPLEVKRSESVSGVSFFLWVQIAEIWRSDCRFGFSISIFTLGIRFLNLISFSFLYFSK